MLGPAGSPKGSRPGQFLGGNTVSDDVAAELGEIEIAAPGAPAMDPYTEEDFTQGQSTDVLDMQDLEELSLAELKAAKAHMPAIGAQPPTPALEKPLPGLALAPPMAKPAAPAPPEHTPPVIADAPAPAKRSTVLYGAAALMLGAAAVVGALVVLDDSTPTPKPAAQANIVTVPAAIGGPVGDVPAALPSADGERALPSAPASESAGGDTDEASADVTAEANAVDEAQVAPAAGQLVVSSTPTGAAVYLDGIAIGETPLRREAVSGSQRLALVLDGHGLYETSVSDGGAFDVDLKPAVEFGGSGGIKVRCKIKDRYRVFVDGIDTGALCPTDRLGVDVGDHVIEIYDLVTGERRSFPASVDSKDRSLRVRVD